MKYFLYFYLLLITSVSIAYEQPTHRKLSEESIKNSVFTNSRLLVDLGLVEGISNTQEFNSYIGGEIKQTINGYIQAGADFEDKGVRPLNHFYDPYNNIGLNSWIGIKSPNWALENDELDELPEQEFSLSDANDYLYRALSGKDLEKETNFGKLFRTLGQVIHHVQDMAQPQHVRDDDHCGEVACSKAEFLGVFHPSLYEELSNDSRNKLPFTGYGAVTYSKARDFWHNSNWSGMADFTNQNFISIGTNFIVNDAGNFFTNVNYPEPKPLNEITQPVRIEDVIEDPALKNLTGWMEFIPTMVADRNLTGTSAKSKNDYGSTLSIFDQDLELDNACVQYTRKLHNGETKTYTYETCRLFTYNSFNVKEAQKYLVPRAVAYSSGLINYFFRGRLDVTKSEQTTDTSGNAIVAITIKNTSTQDFHMTNGTLEIFYDALIDGEEVRKPVQLAQGETGNITELRNGTEITLKIILPTDIDTTKENPFVVVYKGVIGEEPGVAGKVFSVKGETATLLFYKQGGINDLLVKRSVDDGKTWKFVDAANFSGFKLHSSSKGTQLLPSGKGRGILVGQGSNGIYTLRTTDNGKSWAVHLEQAYGQYTEAMNVLKAIHVGDGRLITYNNIYSGTYSVGTRTYYTYDVELSESFDDGKTWTAMGFSTDVNGSGSHLYYLGNQHLYLLTSGYDAACSCIKKSWYESFDLGGNFSKALFSPADLEWYPGWYRDAYAFDVEQIVTTKDTSTDSSKLKLNFAISNDGGKTLLIKDKVAKNAVWPQAEPIAIRPLGQGRFIAYVFDPWTAYEKNLENHYEGILISNDKGQNWKEMYQGSSPTWGYPYLLMMGVLTKDGNNLKYIH